MDLKARARKIVHDTLHNALTGGPSVEETIENALIDVLAEATVPLKARIAELEARLGLVGHDAPAVAYDQAIPDYGDLMPVEKFREHVASGGFIDYDGHGNPARDGKMADVMVSPSAADRIPADATHIVWFNR